MVECLPSMGEALDLILRTRKEKGKDGRENDLGSNWTQYRTQRGVEHWLKRKTETKCKL